MKKLLLFVIACTLGLFGTVNAQKTITIGNGEQSNYSLPLEAYYLNTYSQQSYTKSEIEAAGGEAGTITSIAFHVSAVSTTIPTRSLRVYMNNIDAEQEVTFSTVANMNYPLPNLDGLVFEGDITFADGWVTIPFTTPFIYNGNHLLITVMNDTNDSDNADIYFYVHSKTTWDNDGNSINWASNGNSSDPMDPTAFPGGWPNSVRNNIQLTFGAAGEGGETPDPTPDPEPGDDLATEFSFDFEDGTLTGLRAFAGEGNTAPAWAVSTGSDYYGNGLAIYSMSYDPNTYNTYMANNYVVTENAYAITAESKLSWYVKHTYTNVANVDIYEVVISEDGENFTQIWRGTYDGTNAMEISLAEYAGQSLYIGFRHECTDDMGGDALVLDDIVLSAGEGGGEEPTPEPEEPVTITIGEGTYVSINAPINNQASYAYSYSQQIYLKDEIGKANGLITSIAFHNKLGGSNTRNIVVYANNTEKSSYATDGELTNLVTVSASDIVYEGEFTFGTNETWSTIELQTPFVYTGENLVITVNDKTGIAKGYDGYDQFYATATTDQRCLYFGSYTVIEENMSNKSYLNNFTVGGWGSSTPGIPDVQLTIAPLAAGVMVSTETIALGEVQLGEYWSEKEDVTASVSVTPIMTTVTSITCDNDFFVLPTIDLTASPIEFEVAYNKNAAAGEQTGNLTITYGDGATKVVPMTATAYAPATPDVFELAQEITFTENAYTDAPVFANLKDDYNLPAEEGANAPDAVYAFELAKKSVVTVEVTGTNANYAIYKAEDLAGNGPKADNNYVGETVATDAPVSFFYDFSEENVIENNFTLLDKDGDGYNWRIVDISGYESGIIDGKTLKSDSYKSVTLYPDNYIVTKEKYEITANSVLSFKYYTSQFPDKFGIEVSTDGVNFTSVWSEKSSLASNYAEKVISLSDYAGQAVYIAIRHYESNGNEGYYVTIDDFKLESGLPNSFPTGKYYLVVAAEDAFSVNVNVEKLPTAPEAPVVAATALSDTEIALTWEAVEDALSYNIYSADTLVANVTELTYTVTGLTAETEYTFVVKAVNEVGESEASNVATATTLVPAPTFADYRLESVAKTWGATEYVYDEEMANTVVAVVEDGVSTEISYNEAGQIASAIVYAEEVDSIGNPIEYSSVRYTYNEDGVWVGYKEITQGWMGRVEETNATLNYNENGQLVSVVTDELIQEVTYNEAGLIAEVLASKAVVEDGEEEGEGGFDDGGVVPVSEEENEEDAEEGTEEETVMYTDKKVFEYDEEGRLVKKSTYFYYGEFVLGEVEVYEYDENGNCVSMETYEADEETAELREYPWAIKEYFYDLTINNEDVYSFDYPHFAFINWVEPSHVNILTKVMTYNQYFDEEIGELVGNSYDVTAYNYNPEVLSAPLAPMNVQAEVTSAESIELSWAGFADAETFTIYSADTVYAEGLVDPYYTIEGLEMNVDYCFTVQAVNAVGVSEVSAPACAKIELPAAPANLVATATSDTTIALTWEEVPGIWEYNVYKVVEAEGETTYEFVGQAWWINYTVEGLEAETEYSFVVKSSNNIGESVASNVATAKTLEAPKVPAAPVVEAEATSDTTIVLTWATVEGALSYNVYQGEDSIANVTDTTYTVTGLTADTEYTFTVTAINEVGESEASNEAKAKTNAAPVVPTVPAAPVVEVVEVTETTIVFAWAPVEGALSYNVYQGEDSIANVTDTTYTVTGLTANTEYCFTVTAVNEVGESAASEEVCATTKPDAIAENAAAFNIYPNPVADRLFIETEANVEEVTIYTLTGVMVYSEVDFNNNSINVSELNRGVYIMKVRTENGEAVQRFIKK